MGKQKKEVVQLFELPIQFKEIVSVFRSSSKRYILLHLMKNEGQWVQQKEMQWALEKAQSTISNIAKGLETIGWVEIDKKEDNTIYYRFDREGYEATKNKIKVFIS